MGGGVPRTGQEFGSFRGTRETRVLEQIRHVGYGAELFTPKRRESPFSEGPVRGELREDVSVRYDPL